jgi:hypothetical protein
VRIAPGIIWVNAAPIGGVPARAMSTNLLASSKLCGFHEK